VTQVTSLFRVEFWAAGVRHKREYQAATALQALTTAIAGYADVTYAVVWRAYRP
jgi:hypothetical protein